MPALMFSLFLCGEAPTLSFFGLIDVRSWTVFLFNLFSVMHIVFAFCY